jgi:hypothetical protein
VALPGETSSHSYDTVPPTSTANVSCVAPLPAVAKSQVVTKGRGASGPSCAPLAALHHALIGKPRPSIPALRRASGL